MQSTLFYIPAQFAGLPVFGFGWLLAAWLAGGVIFAVWLARRPGGGREVAAYLPVFLIIAAAIAWLLPNLVATDSAGQPLGIPIRGFGVMLVLATVAGVGLAAYRARQVGIHPDAIYSLAFVMFIAGIVGARLFYIVQKLIEGEIAIPLTAGGSIDLVQTLILLVNVPQGGLVMYGSVLTGVPAGVWYCRRHGLNVLAIGDIIAPSMVLGLALGRVGCFLNGCCFGGVCLDAPYALTFPRESPPYQQQELAGWRSGVWLAERSGKVVAAYAAPGSAAELSGLKPGDEITAINGARVESLADARARLAAGDVAFEIETADGRVVRWLRAQPPARSVPIHPTQLYAALDAGLLAGLLWFFYPFRRRDGEVFALLLTLHPISRFILETIRTDEPKQFFMALTISQVISLAILAAACVLWWYVERQPGVRVQ